MPRAVIVKSASDALTDRSLAIPGGVAVAVAGLPVIRVSIAGHTDNGVGDACNRARSRRPAPRGVDYLADSGVQGVALACMKPEPNSANAVRIWYPGGFHQLVRETARIRQV